MYLSILYIDMYLYVSLMLSYLKMAFCCCLLLCIICAETAILGEASVLETGILYPSHIYDLLSQCCFLVCCCFQETLPLGQSHLGMTSRVS